VTILAVAKDILSAASKYSFLIQSKFHKVIPFIFPSKQLTLEHVRTLSMDDDVLCVRCSPDQRLLAIALLDNTVKVFFLDTLKVYL